MWELQAEFFLHEEQPKKAELAVKKALYLNPADVHAYEDLILVKIKLNDVDGAYKAARASVGLIEAARTSSSHRATVLYYPDHSEHAGDDTILAYSAYDTEPAFDFARLFALLANKFKAIGNDYLAEVCIQLGSTYPNTHAVNAN
jgi:lipoprotein NlpI